MESSKKLLNVVSGVLGAAICAHVLSFPFAIKPSVITMWVMGGFAILMLAVARRTNFQWLYLFPTAMMVMRIVSALLQPDMGLSKVQTHWSLMSLPFIFSLFKFNAVQVRRLLTAIFYVLLAATIVVWISWLKNVAFVVDNLTEAVFHPKMYYYLFLTKKFCMHPSYMAISLCMVLPLAFYLRFNKSIPPAVLWAAIIVVLPLVYFTGARIGIVVCFLLLVVGFVFYIRKFIAPERAAILLLIMSWVLCAKQLPSDYGADPIRSDLRTLGCHAIKETLPWGAGFCSTKKFITDPEFAAKYNLPAYPYDYFHCSLIDEIVQFGWMGAVVLPMFLLLLLLTAVRRRDYLLYSFLVVYVPFLLIESPYSAKSIIPMMFWISLIIATSKERSACGMNFSRT